jgi:hypothetical protein
VFIIDVATLGTLQDLSTRTFVETESGFLTMDGATFLLRATAALAGFGSYFLFRGN